MTKLLRALFAPLLNHLESGDEPIAYKPSHRTILFALGGLLMLMSLIGAYFTYQLQQFGFLIPVLVFGAVGLTCIVVGSVGSDRAVAKIWGNR
jgi:UDP-N-acetylmuramyl pentapeptide phosphotransferase/UDP-N-acetylglucosamine-1-phosphate transferase